jgi:hypothetical protein
MIAEVQQRFAGYRFRLSSGIEAYYDRVRFSWTAGVTAKRRFILAVPISR